MFVQLTSSMNYGTQKYKTIFNWFLNNPYPDPNQSNFTYWHISLGSVLLLSSYLLLGFPRGLFFLELLLKIFESTRIFKILATCSAQDEDFFLQFVFFTNSL